MKKRNIIWFLVIVVILGGLFGYLYYLQMPERIIQKMIRRMSEVKSLEYGGEIEFEYNLANLDLPPSLSETKDFLQSEKLNSDESEKILVRLSGMSDIRDFNNLKAALKLSTNLLLQKIGVELRTINRGIYLRFDEIPSLAFLDLGFLKNQWIEIDLEMIKNQIGFRNLENQLEEAQKEQKLSIRQMEQLKEAIARATIFKFIYKMPSEQINGMDTYRFKVLLDKNGIVQLIAEGRKIIQNKILTGEELNILDGTLGMLDSIKGEIWIGKEDFLLYRVDVASIVEGAEPEEMFTISIRFKDYDKPVEISILSSTKTLEEVLNEFPQELIKEVLGDNSVKFDSE